MAPKLDAGEDWNTVLTNYVEQVRQQMMPNAKSITQTTQDTAELWRTYMQQMQSMMQPWMGVAQQAPGMLTGMMSGNGASNLVEFTRMSWDTFGKTFGSTTLSPSFGLTRELEEKMAKAFAAWQELQEAASEYQVMMNEGWSNVFQQVLQDMKARADQDKPIESLSDLMRVWLSAADKSFDKVFRSETYATVQGRFVTKYMEYRVLEQVVAEEMLKYAYVPSRGEMDEAHRNIYELRKEVRSLKKALNSEKPKGRGRKNEQPAEQHQG
jgi:class III poly(R)-hydroxyalkanoic acid synthase PhaE subunit